jgi:hypothetical protein
VKYQYNAIHETDLAELFSMVESFEASGWELVTFTQAWNPEQRAMDYTAFQRRPK